jgi:hypothetical protein
MDCSVITDADLATVCSGLSAQLSELRLNPILAALITGIIGIMGAFIGAWMQGRSTRTANAVDRRHKAEIQALYDLQDSALSLRLKWQQYLDWKRNGGGDLQTRPHTAEELLDAMGQVEMRASRVGKERVRTATREWMDFARMFYSGADETKYDRSGEMLRWKRVEDYSGAEARSIDGHNP